jgi:S1-C subfamily serine protease
VSASRFQGLPVWSCFPGSVADRAGIKAGDVLLFANGRRVDSMDAYLQARDQDAARLELIVQRGNRILDFTLDLTTASAERDAAQAGAAE